jgi:hypothetical protein
MRRRRRRLDLTGDRSTIALGVTAGIGAAAVLLGEVGRVWRRGSAPRPSEADSLLLGAQEAVAETAQVAREGYRQVSSRENALFNLLGSFATTFLAARLITHGLRDRSRVGPFRSVRLGRRHIHHFVPGIVIAFASGAGAILTRGEGVEPKLAVPFGVGMGLTLDESALLLELDDVYWRREGIVSVQITLAVIALLSALALALRLLREGEQVVLEPAAV